ncbi:molting fluid carboxypeptidase A [Penaeus vannamei]|uniref:Molting fluid carboxypeptidase A n=1 Tax=Penaeus vannamei TaxID=6689 RepID=A0A423SCU5_PENVA|nr:molting fluid carboxypeptidase A [Penaeus vannamei]
MMQQEKQRADRPRDPPLLKSKGRKKTNRMKGKKQFVLIEAGFATPFFLRLHLLLSLPLRTIRPCHTIGLRAPFLPTGAHAREWLSPAMATFLAQKLADAGKKFLQHVAVVLVPMANPDGYEFSHTDDRLWRKNRRNTSKSECKGVDLNRNWSKSWGTSGSSSNPCSEIYRGPQSFSEPESRALRDLARVWIKKFTLFLSLHSYGSYILYPWSHTQTASARNRPLKNIARKITKYLKTNGYKNFLYGQTSSTLYQASGTSEDYMLTAGIKYDYTVELPGFSFQFNVKKIKSVSRAFWEMLVCIFGDIGKQKKLKEYCSKRIVKIMLEDGSSYSDWVDKEIPLDEAKDIVREKYKEKHKNKVQTTTAVNTSLPAATKETMGGF